jgi:hypothetical protein
MIHAEYEKKGNFDAIETEVLSKLDMLVSGRPARTELPCHHCGLLF